MKVAAHVLVDKHSSSIEAPRIQLEHDAIRKGLPRARRLVTDATLPRARAEHDQYRLIDGSAECGSLRYPSNFDISSALAGWLEDYDLARLNWKSPTTHGLSGSEITRETFFRLYSQSEVIPVRCPLMERLPTRLQDLEPENASARVLEWATDLLSMNIHETIDKWYDMENDFEP